MSWSRICALEALQVLARLDPDLVERRAQVPVHVERLALPPRAVEREHELRPQALAVRMRGDQRLQLAGHLGVTSELEVGVDSVLDRGEAQVVEPAAFDLGEGLSSELRQSRPAPERDRLADRVRGAVRSARGERGATVPDEALEADQVDGLRLHLEQVAGCTRHEGPVGQELPQAREIDLHARHRGLGRLVSPQLVDQPLARDHMVRVQDQQREQRPLLGTSERKRPPGVQSFQRSEDPVLHQLPSCACVDRLAVVLLVYEGPEPIRPRS